MFICTLKYPSALPPQGFHYPCGLAANYLIGLHLTDLARCGECRSLFAWVQRQVIDDKRPATLLGYFHCEIPIWSAAWQGRGAQRLEELSEQVWPQQHGTARLNDRRLEKGSGQHSTLRSRELPVFNQTDICAASKATLGTLLRDWAECVRAFPSTTLPS